MTDTTNINTLTGPHAGGGIARGLSVLLHTARISDSSGGIPADRYVVGGGYVVHYTAPVDGVAYLVERMTATVLQMESLEVGERFEVSVAGTEPETIKTMLGIPPSEMELRLYFVPLSDMGYRIDQAARNKSLNDARRWTDRVHHHGHAHHHGMDQSTQSEPENPHLIEEEL